MILEARRFKDTPTKLVAISESEEESQLIDECLGDRPDEDGLCGTGSATVEARLSDGYGQHYLLITKTED